MANDFTKEEKVLWEDMGAAFEDSLSLLNKTSKLSIADAAMERAGDVVWIPQPYIAQSFSGVDQTANFQKITQRSIPATVGFERSAPWSMSAREARDAVQSGNFGKAALSKISSDVNQSLMDVACAQGTLVVPVATAAGDYDDIALCDSIMNEAGISMDDRYLCLSSRDYNGMAGNLATATRSFNGGKSDKAYEKGYVGMVAGFNTSKMDYNNRIAAAAGGGSLTVSTLVGAGNYYTPVAKRVATTGEGSNVDNRFQTITISATTSVAAGDCFTIAGVNAVHHSNKKDSGQLKTFRVISVPSSTTLVISPAIVSNQGATDAEAQYQNVIVTPSATAAIVFKNTTAAAINPFWHKDAISLVPAAYSLESGNGISVMKTTTSQGLTVCFSKQTDINTLQTKYRFDALYGVVNKAPEMSGILLFGQV
jgi:hypothetical protein